MNERNVPWNIHMYTNVIKFIFLCIICFYTMMTNDPEFKVTDIFLGYYE